MPPTGAEARGDTVTLEEPLTVAPSFTAPQMPGALEFSLVVMDAEFTSEPDTVSVRVRDLAPTFDGATVSALDLVQGQAIEPLTLPEAHGGNGDLTYSLTSSPAGLAGLTFDPATRTLSGVPETTGSYTFTYRVEDSDNHRGDSDAALIFFRVTSSPPTAERKAMLEHTLASVGRTAMSSAVDAIGSRFSSGGSTTFMFGARSPGGGGRSGWRDRRPGGRLRRGRRIRRRRIRPGPRHGDLHRLALRECCRRCGRQIAVAHARRQPPARQRLRVDSRGGAGSRTVGRGGAGNRRHGRRRRRDGPAAAAVGALGPRRPEHVRRPAGPGQPVRRRTPHGYIGADVRAGRWLAGLAISRGSSDSDYSFGGADYQRGRLETSLTTVHPYGRWKLSGGDEVWAMLGLGSGEATHTTGDAADRPERSDLSMWMAAGGLRKALAAFRGIDLSLRADGAVAELETDGGSQAVDGLSAGSWRMRVGVEASRNWAVGEGKLLTPFVELGGRYDGGDGATGGGLEVAGGARYGDSRFQLEARGRMLALHASSGYKESGIALTARMTPKEGGEGLSLEIGPRWGAPVNGGQTFWREDMPGQQGIAFAEDGMDAVAGYGFLVPGMYAVLTPFAEARVAGSGGQYRLGVRFSIAPIDLHLELAGEERRLGTADAPPERGILLNARFRF